MKVEGFFRDIRRRGIVCVLVVSMFCFVDAADFNGSLQIVQKEVPVETSSHPLIGIWKKEHLVRVSDQREMREPATHYKFYADSVMLSMWYGKRNNSSLDVSFYGTCGTFRYLSGMAVYEGETELHVKKENEDLFKLTWYDRSQGRSVAFEEEWGREESSFATAIALFLKNVLYPEVKNCFTGIWKVKGIRLLPSEVMVEAPYSSYKVYGDHVFFSFEPRIKDGLCQDVNGQAGAFEIQSDSLILEKGGQNKVEWLDENHFKMTWNNGRREIEELWERADLPDEYSKVLKGLESLMEIR